MHDTLCSSLLEGKCSFLTNQPIQASLLRTPCLHLPVIRPLSGGLWCLSGTSAMSVCVVWFFWLLLLLLLLLLFFSRGLSHLR